MVERDRGAQEKVYGQRESGYVTGPESGRREQFSFGSLLDSCSLPVIRAANFL